MSKEENVTDEANESLDETIDDEPGQGKGGDLISQIEEIEVQIREYSSQISPDRCGEEEKENGGINGKQEKEIGEIIAKYQDLLPEADPSMGQAADVPAVDQESKQVISKNYFPLEKWILSTIF